MSNSPFIEVVGGGIGGSWWYIVAFIVILLLAYHFKIHEIIMAHLQPAHKPDKFTNGMYFSDGFENPLTSYFPSLAKFSLYPKYKDTEVPISNHTEVKPLDGGYPTIKTNSPGVFQSTKLEPPVPSGAKSDSMADAFMLKRHAMGNTQKELDQSGATASVAQKQMNLAYGSKDFRENFE